MSSPNSIEQISDLQPKLLKTRLNVEDTGMYIDRRFHDHSGQRARLLPLFLPYMMVEEQEVLKAMLASR
jgi:hypothetical protein